MLQEASKVIWSPTGGAIFTHFDAHNKMPQLLLQNAQVITKCQKIQNNCFIFSKYSASARWIWDSIRAYEHRAVSIRPGLDSQRRAPRLFGYFNKTGEIYAALAFFHAQLPCVILLIHNTSYMLKYYSKQRSLWINTKKSSFH